MTKFYNYETGMSVLQGIIAYEDGNMDDDEVLDFFQHLVNSGIINHLQGSYQRMATELLHSGMIEHPFPFDVKEAE